MALHREPNCMYIVAQSIKDAGVNNVMISTNIEITKPIEGRMN